MKLKGERDDPHRKPKKLSVSKPFSCVIAILVFPQERIQLFTVWGCVRQRGRVLYVAHLYAHIHACGLRDNYYVVHHRKSARDFLVMGMDSAQSFYFRAENNGLKAQPWYRRYQWSCCGALSSRTALTVCRSEQVVL